MGSCICLYRGPPSHHTSRTKNNYVHVVRPPPTCWVQCMNPKCSRVQRLDCAVDFCRTVLDKTPKQIWTAHLWVGAILPVLRGVDPQVDISVLNCISCCLSAGVSSSLKTKLSKMMPPSDSEGVIVEESMHNITKQHVVSKDPLHVGKRK